MRMDTQFIKKNLNLILLSASITSREIYELQETKEDENEKTKKVGRRSMKRNEKLVTHEMNITKNLWTKLWIKQ